MKKKTVFLTSVVLSLAIFACSINISFANPTPTLPPPRVSTIEPNTPPVPPATPLFDDCADPAIAAYLKETETLMLRYAALSKQFQKDFNVGDKRAMRIDLETIQQITAETEDLKPPPLYVTYHELFSQEIRGFTTVLTAVLNDDTDLAVAAAAEIDTIDKKRMAEVARINQFCRPPSLRKEA